MVILTADAGAGHRRAAEAVAAALQQRHGADCVVEVANPLNSQRVLPWLRGTQGQHDHFSRELRAVYGRAWHASCARPATAILSGGLRLLLESALSDMLKRQRPDVVVSTYPLYQPGLDALLAYGHGRPWLTVVTDWGPVHPLWFARTTNCCLVATERTRAQALANGLPPEKVVVTGVPVDPGLAEDTRRAAAIRAELGWQPELTTVLAVGGPRVAGFLDTVCAVDRSDLPLQLAIVAGGDDDLFALLQRCDWQKPAHVYNWVDNLPALMRAADCVMGKAGGLLIAEALACGRPLVLVDRLPDQEMGNAATVVQSGVGELALEPGEAANTLRRWLAEGGRGLAERARRARAIGRPEAAYAVADRVWQAAQGRP